MEPFTKECGLSTTWKVGAVEPISRQRKANNMIPKVAMQICLGNSFHKEPSNTKQSSQD